MLNTNYEKYHKILTREILNRNPENQYRGPLGLEPRSIVI